MVNITLRNIPDEILKRLKIIAVRERRSLNSELLITLEEGLAARIASESSAYIPAAGAGSLSEASRERLWEELHGAWKDDRTLSEIVRDTYSLRSEREGVC